MATKFVVPDAQARSAAVGDISTLTPALKKVFDPDSQCFKPIRKPKRGEWLAEQKEVGQPFEKFKKHVHNVPHSSYRSVLVLPVGDFHEQASPSLELLAEFARAFFFGLPVQITKAVPLSATKSKTRVNDMTGNLQVLAGDLQRYAAEASKAHARTTFCTIVVTMEDLYPREEWNFVFGQANLLDSVGVFSFARYHPQFPARAKTPLSHSDMKIMLRRSCSVLAHECVHMFGIKHCIFYDCLMNGSNSLEESQGRSNFLCPVCLRKMHDSVGWDHVERYKAMLKFFRKVEMHEEVQWLRTRLLELTGTYPDEETVQATSAEL